jgi:hypothetical protein
MDLHSGKYYWPLTLSDPPNKGYSIKTRFAIIAAGYEGLDFKKEKNSIITSSYAVVTNPVDSFPG